MIRQWWILKRITGNSVSFDKLAKEFGVHKKTIRRDIVALEKAGFPIILEGDYNVSNYDWSVAARVPIKHQDKSMGVPNIQGHPDSNGHARFICSAGHSIYLGDTSAGGINGGHPGCTGCFSLLSAMIAGEFE